MKKLMILFSFCMIFFSCSEDKQKDNISESLSSNLSLNEKIKFLIIYSDEKDLFDAERQVARTIGCTKSSINRILNGEMQPTPLMQVEVENVFRGALKKKSLKSMDKSLNFWKRYIAFWHTPDTTDVYLNTINPLYEEIP